MNVPSVNPFYLVGGFLGGPLAVNALGRSFIKANETVKTQDEVNADVRRLVRDFVLLDAAAAIGLGYAAKTAKSETVKSAAFGGLMGCGLIAGMLGGVLLTSPEATGKPAAEPPATLPPGQSAAVRGSWVSNVIGR